MVLKRFKKLVPQKHTLKNREQLRPFIINRHILTNIVSHESRKSSEMTVKEGVSGKVEVFAFAT